MVEATENNISVQSKIDPVSRLQLMKLIEIPQAGSIVRLTYRWQNHSDVPIQMATWENSRIEHQGTVKFNSHCDVRLSDATRPPTMKLVGETQTITLNASTPDGLKLFISPNKDMMSDKNAFELSYQVGNVTWTKRVEPYRTPAPNESPVEIYFGTNAGFTELEIQGPFQTIAPGGSMATTINWALSTQ